MSKLLTSIFLALACCSPLSAQESPADGQGDVLPGHSYHGEFLNEGPRQKAYLMGGTGAVHFPVTSSHPEVQAFVEQGIGQVYGFWYLEAERSFRHAASLDPECAICYWGAALATSSNQKRSQGFIAEAVKRKDKASDREKMYIDALDAYIKADKSKAEKRDEDYREALENIAIKYPDDLDAKALLALQLYKNRKNGNYLAADALMQQIVDVAPLHPVHHFRIHLWDYKKPEVALDSAARCGQGSPAIAHMWHMPGHIYSRLKRYDDACWQQEASARVDHAHMMRDQVLPDQIHNYAHNNEWLIRNLNHAGRVGDAVDLAKNMIELPRHPKYNTLKSGSTRFGRLRLFETLERYELWDETVALCNSAYLEPTDDELEQIKRLRVLGTALIRSGKQQAAEPHLQELRDRLKTQTEKRDAAVANAEEKAIDDALKKEGPIDGPSVARKPGETVSGDKVREAAIAEVRKKHEKAIDKAKKDASRPFDAKIRELEQAVSELEGHLAVARGDFKAALPLLKKATGVDAIYLARVQHQSGETKAALDAARKHANGRKNEVQPKAALIELLWLAGEKDEARKVFEQLRALSSPIDMSAPVFQRLVPIAEELGYTADWAVAGAPRNDTGRRPNLDTLGPFRWQPFRASNWSLTDAEGTTHALEDFAGKPVVVIFYLGYGCLHCAEQLQAFAPKTSNFRDAGIELIAVSSDDRDGLKQSIENYEKGDMPFPLVSDAELDVFKKWRVYDDFEQQPLHGTFVIDPEGFVLWQDVSYEPFMDPEFVLQEAQRLLSQRAVGKPAQSAMR